MGLGRTTRFARLPAGARRVSVMRAGKAGVKALAPPADLFDDFRRAKAALGTAAAAFERTGYRERFLRAMRGSAESMAALAAIVAEARERDVYVMCMCPYDAPSRACHTYLLLELARELDPKVAILAEPRPRRV